MLLALYSPHGTYDASFLANYAYINITDPITRAPGIGNVQCLAQGNTRCGLWVKPDQLASWASLFPKSSVPFQTQNTVNPAGKGGRRTRTEGSGIYVLGFSAGPPRVTAGIWADRSARNARWRNRSGSGRGQDRVGFAGLQRYRPPQRKAECDYRHVSVARFQRRRSCRERYEANGRDEATVS